MTSFQAIENKLSEMRKAGQTLPRELRLTPADCEAFLREAIKRKPNYLIMKPGKVTYRGVKIHLKAEESRIIAPDDSRGNVIIKG